MYCFQKGFLCKGVALMQYKTIDHIIHPRCVDVHPCSVRPIGIYHETVINMALHGEPSAPDKFNGAAFKK